MLKRHAGIWFCFLLLIGCIGCSGTSRTEASPDHDKASMTGYVVRTKDSKALVVAEAPRNDRYDAVWVSGNGASDLHIGQKIEVTFQGEIQTSDPGQAAAERIQTVPMPSPDQTNLTPEQALAQALQRVERFEVPIVKRIAFQPDARAWSVVIADAKNELAAVQDIVIEDK